MTVWAEGLALAKRVAADMTAVVNRILFLENISVHSALDVNTDYEDKDPTTGRFKTITHKRGNGTIIRRTTYEVDPDVPAEVPPKLNLKVVTIFAKDGITILQEVRYRVTYDSEGDITSETVLSE
ncbi:MAG: hypothetical protein RR877_00295 [Aurantimicrobium sp.]|uniref:hypothetical protein n=1 Tax=Aurantimicrobium sp. TaxID=1930784 RepID=UPI002FCB20CA